MDNQRQIAKQEFDKHPMFKDNPIAWSAWKMAFDLGVAHQQELHQRAVIQLRTTLVQALVHVQKLQTGMDEATVIRYREEEGTIGWVIDSLDEVLPIL